MLYSCEIWGQLTKTQVNELEKVQKHVAKRVQGLHWRTHDEVARGLLGLYTMKGYINKRKLAFIHKLINLDGKCLSRQIFLHNFDKYSDMPHLTSNCTSDLLNVCKQYKLFDHVLLIIKTGNTSKASWKKQVNCAIYENENTIWQEGLVLKENCLRLLDVQGNLKVNNIYYVIRRNPRCHNDLLTLARTLALKVNEYIFLRCNLCNQLVNDIMEHVLIYCTGLNVLRENMWGNLIDELDVIISAELFSLSDKEIINVFLTGDLIRTRVSESASDFCVCNVAKTFGNMMDMVTFD